ncbi:MAG TPA: zf-HC2 domain-containing protein [Longimicrobiales bacterium]
MTHPGMEALLAHIDRELPPQEANEVAGHIASCGTCSLAVAGLRETSGALAGAVSSIDRWEPASWQHRPDTVAQVLPLERPARRGAGAGLRLLPRAAGILLLIGAAASAAIITGRTVVDRTAIEAPPEQTAPVSAPGAVTSVAVTPAAGAVVIVLTGAGPGSRVYVTLADRADAAVTTEGAGTPHFTAADGRVDIALGGSAATIRVALPRSLREARVVADRAVVVTFDGTRLLPASASRAGVIIGGVMQTTDP